MFNQLVPYRCLQVEVLPHQTHIISSICGDDEVSGTDVLMGEVFNSQHLYTDQRFNKWNSKCNRFRNRYI